MTDHPSSIRLETFAAGVALPEIAAHVETCAACKEYVERVRVGAKAFREQGPSGTAFAASIEKRIVSEEAENKDSDGPAVGNVVPLVARKRSKFSQVAWIAGPTLAAAAGILLLVRGTGTMGAPGEAAEVAAIRFKGNTEASVIRERGGTQLRFTEEVAVRGNDRLRVEISVTAPQVLTAGLLEEKGVWNVLLAPKTLAVGAHPSEFAARIDVHGATGWILVGEPALVEHARTSRDFSSVRAIRVTTEPPPVEEEGRRPSSERSRGERDGAVFGGGNRAPR